MSARKLAAALLPAATLVCASAAPAHARVGASPSAAGARQGRDAGPDVRRVVRVHRDGERVRFTVGELRVGMPVAEAFAALGVRPDPLLGGAVLRWGVGGDLGTRLDILYGATANGTIRVLDFVYEGDAAALATVRGRWIEALGLGSEGCDDRRCYWDDGEKIASMWLSRTDDGRPVLTVSLAR